MWKGQVMGRGIDKLHPAVRDKAERLERECKALNIPLLITETWRSKEEQDALYAKGRTVPGGVVTKAQYPNSMHCWGLAFDFCRNVRGLEYDDRDGFFALVGDIGRKIGLVWGGDWAAFKDKPHFEDRSIAGALGDVVKRFGTPETFIESWGK